MKRYLIRGNFKESDKEKRRAGRDKNFYPDGEGRILIGGDVETGGFYLVAECKGPIKEYLADLISQAEVEITPINLCPKDCYWCPPMVVPPLRAE
jgi:hypothetical protein